jgi:hypothetical protein
MEPVEDVDLLGLVLARLTGTKPLVDVATSADFAALVEQQAAPSRMPAAWIMPIAIQPREPAVFGSATQQLVRETIGVLIAVKHAGDASGGKALDALVAPRRAVRARLHGWLPHPEMCPLELGAGRLAGVKQGTVFWLQHFATDYALRGRAEEVE